MKKIVSVLAGLVIGSASFVIAQPANFSGSALNPATTTQSAIAAAAANPAILQDQSKLPDQDNRSGYLTVLFNVAVDGGSGTVDAGPVIPAGTAVVGGFAHVVTAFTPAAAATNLALTVQAAGDLKPVATSFGTTGLKRLVPSSDVALTLGTTNITTVVDGTTNTYTVLTSATGAVGSPIVVTGSQSQVSFAFGSAATQGVALVHLDLIKVQ
jgi:hypothetical protein